MKKFKVYGLMTASVLIGEYEAENADAAIELADLDGSANWSPLLCHHCANEVELGEVYKTYAVKR